MKTIHQSHGKISDHFKGIGTVTRDTVVARAREIALINGRGPNHFTQEDFSEAKRELTGELPDPTLQAEEESVAGLVAWDESPDAAGHPVQRELLDDEQTCASELIAEGMDEAQHEQMFEGARDPHNQE